MNSPENNVHPLRGGTDAASALAFQVCDSISCLEDTHRAYTALECLISPSGIDDGALQVERGDLGSLLRVMNEGMRQRIGDARQVVTVARQPAA